jgi:hypothetical protein
MLYVIWIQILLNLCLGYVTFCKICVMVDFVTSYGICALA